MKEDDVARQGSHPVVTSSGSETWRIKVFSYPGAPDVFRVIHDPMDKQLCVTDSREAADKAIRAAEVIADWSKPVAKKDLPMLGTLFRQSCEAAGLRAESWGDENSLHDPVEVWTMRQAA